MIKKICGLLLGVFCFFAGAFSVRASVLEGIRHDVLSIPLRAGVEQLIVSPFVFQSYALDQVKGIEVKYRTPEGWVDAGELDPDEDENFGSGLLFVPSSDALLFRSDQDRLIKVTLMNLLRDSFTVASLDTFFVDPSLSYLSDPSQDFRVISRREWGADESLRTYVPDGKDDDASSANSCAPLERSYPGQYRIQDKVVNVDSQGRNLIWPQTYSDKIKKIVVHHTAKSLRDLNEDGRLDVRDYRLAVQAIYVYHTVSNGWGDIGYHYLVDPDGNVYEGRAGGLNVVAAHVLCQNSNTIGIAVMGNFEEERVSKGSFEGLVQITQHVSKLYGISPLGKSSFRGTMLPNIVTHAEVGDVTKSFIGKGGTACPGVFLKNEMPRLRQVVAAGGLKLPLAFEILEEPRNIRVAPLQEVNAVYTLKNTGEQTWTSMTVSIGRKEVFSESPLLVDSGRQFDLRLPLQSGLEGGRERLSFSLSLNGQKMSQGLLLDFVVDKPQYRYELLSLEGGEYSLLLGEERSVSVTVQNTSNFPWLNEGPYQVQLQEVVRRGNDLVFQPRGLKLFLSERVDPGEQVHLSFSLPVQRREGVYQLELIPALGREKGFRGKRIALEIPVEKPRFAAEVTPTDVRMRLDKGYEQHVSFQIINTSNFDWEANMVKFQMGVGRDSKELLIDRAVARGESFEFSELVRAPYEGRTLGLRGLVVLDKAPSFFSKSVLRSGRVSFDLSLPLTGRVQFFAEKIAQSDEQFSNEAQEISAWVDLKNKGTVPWYGEGQGRIVLSVQDKADFSHSGWERRTIAGILQQKQVLPGETGRFLLPLQVRKPVRLSTYDEFLPVIDGYENLSVRVKGGVIRFGILGTRSENKEATSRVERKALSSVPVVLQTPVAQSVPPMRVLLMGIDQDEVQLTADGTFHTWVSDPQKTKEYQGGEVVTIKADQLTDGTIIRMKAKSLPFFRFLNWHRVQSFGQNLDDNMFRNVLEFRWDADEERMIVINELSLEDYMKGVAEVPETDDQPEEKRKVIAVLSRSYALHYLISGYEKFPGKPYNAADSPAIFQKYLGYGFEKRAPKWIKALRDTEWEVVLTQVPGAKTPSSKEGQVLRAAYFSCTDGDRTRSWDEVWPDNAYFQKFGSVFQSVEDPYGDDPTREGAASCGHQVGLSGYGATQMAKEGWGYRDIIEYYYQGVSLENFEF